MGQIGGVSCWVIQVGCHRRTHCLSGGYIANREDTLCFWGLHCLSGRHIVCPQDTLSLGRTHCLLRLNNDCRSSLACRSLARSIAHSLSRSLARSIDHSLARSLARSIARSLTCAFFKANTKETTKGAARPKAVRLPLWWRQKPATCVMASDERDNHC